MSMAKRTLGRGGPQVSAIGLGCMGMSEFYGATDDKRIDRDDPSALERGVDFLDTADMYGPFKNEELVGKAIADRRDKVFLATKFGNVRGTDGAFLGVRGDAAYVRSACEASLMRLGVEMIDLYYQHRVDPNVPIEETVGAMAELMREGRSASWASRSRADTIRRAHATHQITALQTEYSLWSRDAEDEVLPTVRELGIGYVAYSPLGRGFLTGEIRHPDDFPEDDFRRLHPRFTGENFKRISRWSTKIEAMARAKGCTAAQLALAWVLAQGEDIVPIPGTKRRNYLDQNIAAVESELSRERA